MSIKLKSISLKDNKTSNKQYDFELNEEMNTGLLHQVTKAVSYTHLTLPTICSV